MNINQIVKSKKFKNVFITVLEILVVAGLIFGVLMFFLNKVNEEADKSSGLGTVENQKKEEKKEDKGSNKYYIEVNMKKSAVIVYQYLSDKKTKKPYKAFQCSVGSDVKKGEYKTSGKYSWIDINGSWHRYNTRFSNKAWIQSAGYRDKYANTLKKDSYKAIGGEQEAGSCILLYAKDAEWIYNACSDNTVINVVKGSKKDELPMAVEDTVKTVKYCGWDPTDPDKANPYKSAASGKIATGLQVVYVEKGHDVEYLSNLLAKDENGKNVTGLLNYNKIDTTDIGTYKVQYSYQTKSGKKLKVVQRYEVIDTTPPTVKCSTGKLKYEIEINDTEDSGGREDLKIEEELKKEETKKDIENKVRSFVSCNESDVKITVSTVSKEELILGENVVTIKAQDKSGNVGSCQVICEISIKEKKRKKPEKVTQKKEKETKKEAEKATTKPKEKETEKKTERQTTEQSSESKEEESSTVNQ